MHSQPGTRRSTGALTAWPWVPASFTGRPATTRPAPEEQGTLTATHAHGRSSGMWLFGFLRSVPAACAAFVLAACGVLVPAHAHQPSGPASAGRRPIAVHSTPLAGPCIYRLLPFTQQQLSSAAALAGKFTALYGPYRYNQPLASYLARLKPLTTSSFQAVLAQGAAAPGLLQQRAQGKTTATTSATVTAIRDIAGTSITFLVTADQHTTTAGVTRQHTQDYAVTVTATAGTWKVYAIELASAGQAGGMP
jgi:hypothetical protein